MKNKKSGKVLPVVIILLAVALIALVSCKSFGFGNGNGSGDESGNNAQQVMATVSETTISTSDMEYVEITVHENSYIFDSNVYELDDIDDLIDFLKGNALDYTVKITDDNASAKAYSQLITTFDENKIKYIEISE